jgi:protein-L-isoaspartate(D-aspartate) O-methyltransferase
MDAKYQIEQMIETIRNYGVTDERIFEALRKIPRHLFVLEEYQENAYDDFPLPIHESQTISQPYTVAFMIQELELKDGQHVLEIGTGSGWSAAIMQYLIGNEGTVITVERFLSLVEFAKENLHKVHSKAHVILADGSLGYPTRAPYDRIIVTAACPEIPKPFITQLKEGGILIAPVGRLFQTMIKAKKVDGILKTDSLGTFRFVPLKGRHGF